MYGMRRAAPHEREENRRKRLSARIAELRKSVDELESLEREMRP